jgi:hypothetical protein
MPYKAFAGNVSKIAIQLNEFEQTGVIICREMPLKTNSGQEGLLVMYIEGEPVPLKEAKKEPDKPVGIPVNRAAIETAKAMDKNINEQPKRKPGRPRKKETE